MTLEKKKTPGKVLQTSQSNTSFMIQIKGHLINQKLYGRCTNEMWRREQTHAQVERAATVQCRSAGRKMLEDHSLDLIADEGKV